MKPLKYILLTLAVLLLVLIIAVAIIALRINPNDYKPQITAWVADITGYQLAIVGDIELSLFPWLGLELGKLQLANPAGFTEPYLLAIDSADIKVAILPLFKKQIQIATLRLDGLTANLEKLSDGRANWQPPVKLAATDTQTEADTAKTNTPADQTAVADNSAQIQQILADLSIGGIEIVNASLQWRDASNDNIIQIDQFDLIIGKVRWEQAIPFSLEFAVRQQTPKIIGEVKLNGQLFLSTTEYRLTELALRAQLAGESIPNQEQLIALTMQSLLIQPNITTITLNQLKIELANLTIGLAATVSDYADKPELIGNLMLQTDSLRKTMQQLGVELPVTQDDKVFGNFQLQTELTANNAQAILQALQLKLDDSSMAGEIKVSDYTIPAIEIKLQLDTINADRYMPLTATQADQTNTKQSIPAPESAPAPTPSAADTRIELPVEYMRTADLDIKFNIQQFQLLNLKTSDVAIALLAKNGIWRIEPFDLALYQGQAKNQLRIDVTKDLPAYQLQSNLSNVTLGPLLADYQGKRLLEGKANFDIKIDTQGEWLSKLKQELNGQFKLAFFDGALSMDVRQQILSAKNELKSKLGKEPKQTTVKSEPSKFASITASGDIKKGTVFNEDLAVKARYFYVTGKGNYSIPTDKIDYVLTLILSDDDAGQDDSLQDLYDLPIEIPLRGTLAELDYTAITLSALTKSVQNKLKAEAKARLEEEKAEKKARIERKLQEEQDELKQKTDKEKDKAKEKVDEAIRDKLKKMF